MPGCSDVVRDGWSGFLVAPRAPHTLASRIITLLDNRAAARTMAVRASEQVRQEFGLDLTIARCVAAYNELLDEPVRNELRGGKAVLDPELLQRKRAS
jgi:glycosyltransferase involved in cell wall biosynthesis